MTTPPDVLLEETMTSDLETRLQGKAMNIGNLFLKSGASFSADRTLRFKLWRRWAEGPVCCYIGHNPSDAAEDREDPTSHMFMHFAKVNGCGAYIAVNQYPLVTAKPSVCRKWAERGFGGPDWENRDAMFENRDIVAQTAKAAKYAVACWGALAQDKQWTESIIEAITTEEEPWPDLLCLGTTLSGAPKHPMARGKHRIPSDQKFMVWRHGAESPPASAGEK